MCYLMLSMLPGNICGSYYFVITLNQANMFTYYHIVKHELYNYKLHFYLHIISPSY